MHKKFTRAGLSPRLLLTTMVSGMCLTSVQAQVDVTATAGTATASYTNLNMAFAAINAGTHQGDITVDLSASFTNTAVAVLNSSGAGAAVYTSVLVRPTVDNVTISFASAGGFGVIELNGADNVTIDGDNPNTAGINRDLTVTNTAANTVTFTSAIRVAVSGTAPYSDNTNITLKNINVNGSATGRNNSAVFAGTANNTFGIIVSPGAGATTSAVSNVTNGFPAAGNVNNFTVDNCAVNSCARGIAFLGNTTTPATTGINITNNVVGSSTPVSGIPPYNSPATTVYAKGIYVQGTQAANVSGNTVQNIVSYATIARSGIELGAGIGTGATSITNNTVRNICQNDISTNLTSGIVLLSAGAPYNIAGNTVTNVRGIFDGFSNATRSSGIIVGTTAPSGMIQNNKVSQIYNDSQNGLPAYGIALLGGNAITVQNNMVWDIKTDLTLNDGFYSTYCPMGIIIGTGTNHKIYHNSVNLYGSYLGTGPADNMLSAAFGIVSATSTGVDVRNNIFSNTMVSGGFDCASVSVWLPSGATSAMNLTINNNAYYTGTTADESGIAQTGGTYTTANLYTAANFDAASTTPATNLRSYTSALSAAGTNDDASVASTMAAPYISATDLHINFTAPNATDIDAKGTVLTTTLDIDGETRNATTPDLGADEFEIIICSTPVGGTIPATLTACQGSVPAITAAGSTVAVGITYQWEVSSTSGTGFASVTGGTGANTTSYTPDASLAPGVYYFRLNVTCSTGPSTDYSNEIMVTVDPTPTAVASIDGGACVGQDVNLLGTSDIATAYSWSGPAGYTSTDQNPVLTAPATEGTYSFTATLGSCSASSDISVMLKPSPTTVMAGSTSTLICHGTTVDLNASADSPYNAVLLSENFNGTPAGWSTINSSVGGATADAAWTLRADGYEDPDFTFDTFHSNDNSQFYLSNSDAQGVSSFYTDVYLMAPPVNTVGYSSLSLDFFHFYGNLNTDDIAAVDVSTDGTSWTTVNDFNAGADIGLPGAFEPASVDLSTYVGNPSLYVRFHFYTEWGYAWAIDNVTISGEATDLDYSWTSMPAGFMSTDQNPTGVMVNDTTDFIVTVTNIFGCSADASVTVNTQGPDVTATSDALPGNIVCNGSMLTLTGTGTADSYTWDMGVIDGAAFTPADTATYIVTGVETATGCVDRDTITIYVNNVPTVAAASDDADNAVCDGSNVTLTGSGADSYAWDNSVTDGVAFMPAATTTYTVTGTTDGCSNTASITITVNDLPTVTANSDDADNTVCSGTSVTLTGGGASTYTWDNSVLNGFPFSAASTTTYTVTGTDINGCQNTASLTLTVNVVNITTSTAGFTITANAAPATYQWINCGTGNSPIAGATAASYTATANGSYAAVVTQSGCSDTTACVTITGIGINELGNYVFALYPNPTTGAFTIEGAVEANVTVMGMQGEVVMSTRINAGKNQLNTGDIARGMYMVKITDLDGNIINMQRLVVTR